MFGQCPFAGCFEDEGLMKVAVDVTPLQQALIKQLENRAPEEVYLYRHCAPPVTVGEALEAVRQEEPMGEEFVRAIASSALRQWAMTVGQPING